MNTHDHEQLAGRARVELDRREALLRAAAGAALLAGFGGLLTGCSSGQGQRTAAGYPDPRWPDAPGGSRPYRPPTTSRPAPSQPGWSPSESVPSGVTARSTWARGEPIPARMDPMRPIHRITIHHDGMPPVALTSRADVATRLEAIRVSHLKRNFGDIGYHYIVDPMGGVWQGRPMNWQGAHVANQNEGNIGVLCLGNFETQRPTEAQINAMHHLVRSQMSQYRVGVHSVYTHRELGPSICPGRNLQAHMASARAPGGALTRF